jgi:hypothetical protein
VGITCVSSLSTRAVRGGLLRLIVMLGLFTLSGCPTAGPPAAAACKDGTAKPCSCDGGASATMLCSSGAFGTCQCDKQGVDALGDAGIAADSADPDDAQPDSTQAEVTGPDGVVAEDAQGDVSESACQSDKDCKDLGKVCDPLTKVCVACLTDAECAPNQHCVAYACQGYTPCVNSLACKGAKGPDGKEQPICDQTIGECSACLSAADCPASHDCTAKQCIVYTTCKNSTDCSKDEVCDKAANRCVQCLGDNDCTTNQLCENGKCNAYIPCTSDKQCTDKGLLCNQSIGKCAQCLQNTDCPAIYNCQPAGVAQTGVCVIDICAPGQGACSNNAKVTCNSVGDGYGSPQSCPNQTTCVAPGGKPECKAWACAPGANCQGDKAVECSSDGFEVVKTTDCAASGQKCFAGACKAQICSPGQAFCDGQVAKQCDAAGGSSSTVKTCGLSEFCDGGTCKPQICLPNQPVCDANSAKTCNSVGSGYTDSGKDCGPTAKCISGDCKAKLCTPATQFCEAGFLKTCSPDGTSVTGSAECGTGKYCGLNAGGDAACLPWTCEPNKPSCNGTVATTCKGDGSGYQDAGTECKIQGKICAQGLCKSLLCDPLAPAYCDLNTAMKCDASGLNSSTVQVCGVGTYCDKGTCQKQICEPGKAGCYGQIASICNAAGSGWVEGGTDCKAASKVCGAGACLAGFASCKAALAANPTAIDGLYSIDPDGAGPIAGAELFCDMKNGGLTLVANIFNTAGDDMPNDTSYVVSGWQQTGNGAWQTSAYKVDRDATGKGSAAVSMAFVAALKASAGQQHLKMCFVDQGGAEVACRSSADASLTLASHPGGNPKLAAYSADKLTYTFGRLAGLPGPMDCYNTNACFGSGYCIGVQPGGSFGNGCGTQPGICGFGGVGKVEEQPGFVWHGFCGGGAYAPYRAGGASHLELTDPTTPGFRLYVGYAAASPTYSSCKAALSANPTAIDGLYPIDPDGAGPIAPVELFCDMKNGGLTLVANIYDSAGDDAPNESAYVVSGWQQTANGKWEAKASKIERNSTGSGSGAVSLEFVKALAASAGQKHLKLCLTSTTGTETTCYASANGSLTLVSNSGGNPKLAKYAEDKLTYTFGRLAGLAGTADTYDTTGLAYYGSCIPIGVGKICEEASPPTQCGGIWHVQGYGITYRPMQSNNNELGACTVDATAVPDPDPNKAGFRLYIGP